MYFCNPFSNIEFFVLYILQIDRTQPNKDMAPVFTDLAGKLLHGRKGFPSKGPLLSSLSKKYTEWRQPKRSE